MMVNSDIGFNLEPRIEDHVIHNAFATYHHIPLLMAAYLLIVKYVGPRFMEGKRPFDLKAVIMVYNLVQIAANLVIIVKCCFLMGIRILDPWGHPCDPVTSVNHDLFVKDKVMNVLSWYYFNKIVDCLETVFFILRKKESQVTFLHVYHHLIMIYSSWISAFILLDEMLVQFAALNGLIHVIMYIYYFLSSLGPGMQRYLWWKKYLTGMQIGQFVLVITMLVNLLWVGCDHAQWFALLWLFNCSSLLVLFVKFFTDAYQTKVKQ